eukprot:CCRYP_012169-RA/>CCRYP_012169-RA protein AED:0.01 eAED:0.01 QI:113/1/1/1/1/1/2/1983/639
MSTRRSNRARQGSDNGSAIAEEEPNPTQSMRDRSRAVAEREASRLARPDQASAARTLGHASKSKSAVMSTPLGSMLLGRNSSPGVNSSAENHEWCGPFSIARQMIAAREEAKRLREEQQAEAENPGGKEQHPLDEAMEIVELERQRKENPSMNWISRHNRTADALSGSANYYAKRRKRFHRQKELAGLGSNTVPSLFQLCINFLVKNFDHVDSLGIVDHSIRRALCENLVAEGKMNGAAFDVLAEMGVETLELIDCAQVTQDQMCEALQSLLPSGLRAILLKHCGRCFGKQAVKTISEIKNEDLDLFAISLSGAYLLKDEDAAKLLASTSRTLSSIELIACPLIGMHFCTALGEHFSSSRDAQVPGGCLLELSLEDIPLTKEALLSLGAASDSLRKLKSLRLRSIDGLDDEVVSIVLGSIEEGSLEGIDLSNNPNLTDDILSSIRRCNFNDNLRSLQLSSLKNLTAIGLEAFFTDIPDLPSPPMLRKLDLSNCSYDEINDTVVTLAAKASSFKRSLKDFTSGDIDITSNPEQFDANVIHSMGLVHCNIAGSSVSDKTMEILAVCCKSSLEELDVSSCSNISDKGLGYLVSKLGSQFSKVHVWGLAQLTEEFFDGHDRAEDGGLEIVGIWMKKSGGRSVR